MLHLKIVSKHFPISKCIQAYARTQLHARIHWHTAQSQRVLLPFSLSKEHVYFFFFSDFSSVKWKTVYLRNKEPYCHCWQIGEQQFNLWFHNQRKEFWFRQLPVLLNIRDCVLLCLFSSTLKIKFGKAHAAVTGTVLALHCEPEYYHFVFVAPNKKICRINLKDWQQVWFKSKIQQYKRKLSMFYYALR